MKLRRLQYSVTAIIGMALAVAGLQLAPAQAHVLESDGNIAAVLHMPPDDSPQAGQDTILGLAFASSELGFDIKNYAVTITIKQKDATILTETLAADSGSSHDGSANVTLPKAGAYRLEVEGKPLHAEQPFSLSYTVRASLPSGSTEQVSTIGGVAIDFWILNAGVFAMFVLLAQYQIRAGGRYELSNTSGITAAETKHRKTPVQH